jgi:dsDNA-specific endonuclease/ATPase MutS2
MQNAPTGTLYFELCNLTHYQVESDFKARSSKFKAQSTVRSEDYNPFPEPVVIEITDVFDLHTIPPKQVKAVVEEYLREAHAKGFPVVRIIHGKGVGVQREIVRTILGRTPFVIDWTDAPPDAGGLGATIVRLK